MRPLPMVALMVSLRSLSTYRFEGKNEAAIREQWVYPLLDHLGYGADTLDDVLFEQQLQLREPIRRLGSRRIKVDYRPTVLGHNLWIIEAKAPDSSRRDVEHLGQAWTYATHPEVNVAFMAIADGARLRVFDVTRVNWDEPLIDLPSTELERRFAEVVDLLGPRKVARALRRRHLEYLEQAIQAELDLGVCDDLLRDVAAIVDRARPVIAENRRSVVDHQEQTRASRDQVIVERLGVSALAQEFNVPWGFRPTDVDRVCAAVMSRPPAERAGEFEAFVTATRHPRAQSDVVWRPYWAVRAMRLWVALRLAGEDGCEAAAQGAIGEAVPQHLLRFPGDPMSAAAHRFEQVLPHALMRAVAAGGADRLDELARVVNTQWEPERVLRYGGRFGLNAPRLALSSVLLSCRRIWLSTASCTAEELDVAATALHGIADAAMNELRQQRAAKGQTLLRVFAGGVFRDWRPEEDQLVAYTVLALEDTKAGVPIPVSAEPVVRAASAWSGAVAPAATRLLQRR